MTGSECLISGAATIPVSQSHGVDGEESQLAEAAGTITSITPHGAGWLTHGAGCITHGAGWLLHGVGWLSQPAIDAVQVGSHVATDAHLFVAAILQPSRCRSRSIQRPAETGLKVTRVHIVATNASRTQ